VGATDRDRVGGSEVDDCWQLITGSELAGADLLAQLGSDDFVGTARSRGSHDRSWDDARHRCRGEAISIVHELGVDAQRSSSAVAPPGHRPHVHPGCDEFRRGVMP